MVDDGLRADAMVEVFNAELAVQVRGEIGLFVQEASAADDAGLCAGLLQLVGPQRNRIGPIDLHPRAVAFEQRLREPALIGDEADVVAAAVA